jgi:hypothetical protein
MKPNGHRANKPFTARSLVGISQSARKHTIRALFVELVFTSQGTAIEPTDKGSRWFHLWCRGSGDAASRDPEYAALRAKYRIGERLRPCPGCWNCQTTWQQSSIYSQTAVMHRHGCSHDDPSGLCCFGETVPVKMECDGSGVLPARKAR